MGNGSGNSSPNKTESHRRRQISFDVLEFEFERWKEAIAEAKAGDAGEVLQTDNELKGVQEWARITLGRLALLEPTDFIPNFVEGKCHLGGAVAVNVTQGVCDHSTGRIPGPLSQGGAQRPTEGIVSVPPPQGWAPSNMEMPEIIKPPLNPLDLAQSQNMEHFWLSTPLRAKPFRSHHFDRNRWAREFRENNHILVHTSTI